MSNIIQIIRPKKKKHNFHLQIWRTPLGVDALKEWEAFDYNFDPKKPRKHVLYGGWFLFSGELVEGFDKRPGPVQNGFAYWFTTSFPTGTPPEGLKLCAIEFLAEIPWVLPESSS